MDSTQSKYKIERPDNDADLNLLLYKSGKSLKNLFYGIGRGIGNIFRAIGQAFMFVVRNFIWIMLGGLVGSAYGFYLMSSNGPKFTSTMTVQSNFGSARTLYNSIEYFNSLVAGARFDQLSQLLNKPVAEVKNLRYISAEPVKSEAITADLYNELFRKDISRQTMAVDTFWQYTLKYEDFKESLTKMDYPVHTVTIASSNPSVFQPVQDALLKHASSSDILQQASRQQQKINLEEEKLLLKSLSDLDSLRQAYNVRLARGQAVAPSNQLMVVEGSPEAKTPELDLYDKLLALQDELRQVRLRSVTQQKPLELLTPVNPAGKKESITRSLGIYVLIGALFVLAVLILLSIRRADNRQHPGRNITHT